jgi:type IV secretion system protein VirB5
VNTPKLTSEQSLLTDEIANERYVGFYAERRLSRMVITAGSVLLLGSFGVIVSLSHRPVQNRYIRIDEMGKATAIQYSDLAYSPREGEVRTYLTDWANYRYTINRETIAKKYSMVSMRCFHVSGCLRCRSSLTCQTSAVAHLD